MRKEHTALLSLFILWTGLGLTGSALAQAEPSDEPANGPTTASTTDPTDADTEEPEDARARAVYEAGEVAFSEGQFREAARLFQRAYELSARPILLYNVAMAHDRAGHDATAIQYYESFLERAPGSDHEAYVRSRLAVLYGQGEAEADSSEADPNESNEEEEEEEAETVMVPEPIPHESSPPVGAIVAFSLAGVSVIAGGIVAGMALGIQSDLESRCPDQICAAEDEEDVTRMGRLALASDILFGVAIAGAITGVILLVTGGSDEDAPAVSASCDGTGCRLYAQTSF